MSHQETKTFCLSTCHCVTLPGAYLATAEHGVVKQCHERPKQDIIFLRTEKYDIFNRKKCQNIHAFLKIDFVKMSTLCFPKHIG